MSSDLPDDTDQTTVVTRDMVEAAMSAVVEASHFLVPVAGQLPRRPIELGPTPVTFGRDRRQLVSVHDPDLSRLHFQVSVVDDRVVLEDMGSTNGTFVNDVRVVPTTNRVLVQGDEVRAGHQRLRYEHASRQDLAWAARLANDLSVARGYVQALLPDPLSSGPIRTTWHFEPSAELGGDAFGYRWLDDGTFAFYLLDVSGHGAGSAMHSVAVLNLLRAQDLPDVDLTDPASVLRYLNARFPMEQHGGLFFTMWYGVYRTADRSLRYASAGHHPAFVVNDARTGAEALEGSGLMIGAMAAAPYAVQQTSLTAGASVYLFSDGAFEIDTTDAGMWRLENLVPHLHAQAEADTSEAERLYHVVAEASASRTLADDFSMLVLTFD